MGRWTVKAGLTSVYFDSANASRDVVDEYSRPWNKPGYVGVLGSLGRDFFSDAFHRMSDKYPRVATPLLIVWGEQDKWITPKSVRRLAKIIPTSKLVTVPHCGHLPHQEKPELANQLMLDFLQEE